MFNDATTQLLQPGSVGVLPTDTVYGLTACASDQTAVQRLYALKSRDCKPGTLIAADIDQLVALGIKRRYLSAVSQYWPGAVSVVISCDANLAYLHQGKYSLAVRIPDNDQLRALLQSVGPLLTSSANHPGQPTATTVVEARAYFGDQVDFYVDGGDLSDHQPSTILRVVDDAVEIIRIGAVSVDI